jgi:hypothetical protein
MKLVYKIIAAFTPPPSPLSQKMQEERRKRTNARIVSTLSEGNVLLQKGKYLTQEDMEQRKSKLAGYKF